MKSTDPGVVVAIDDDLFSLRLISDILTSAGYVVHEFQSASKAIEEMDDLQAEMVLLDLRMEEMNGLDACRRIKERPLLKELPVIFITGDDDEGSIAQGFQAGAVDYITKPLRRQELLARLQTHLTISRLKRKLNRQNEQLAQEIDERSRLMAQIIRGKKEWEAVFDSVTDMIFLTDEQYRVVRCNLAAADRFERLSEEVGSAWQNVLNRPIGELLYGDPTASSRLAQVKEVQFPELGGWFDVSMYPIYEENNRRMTVYIIKDISARKQVEEALVASQKFASLGTLVAGIAHEINSPLQVLTGLTKSLSTKCESGQLDVERLQHSLDMLYRNSWRVAEIVRALRLYARDSDNQFDFHDLNAIVKDTLLLIEHQLESWSNIVIHTEFAEDLLPMECNRDLISQVLINLLTNSRDAMPLGGEITVRTGHDPDLEQLLLEVSDSGGGIPEAIQNKIFDPFFTTKPIGQGTGLGLSIIMGIVRSHHGEIKVQSRPGEGSQFTLIFPAHQPASLEKLAEDQVYLHGRYFEQSLPNQ